MDELQVLKRPVEKKKENFDASEFEKNLKSGYSAFAKKLFAEIAGQCPTVNYPVHHSLTPKGDSPHQDTSLPN